MRRDATVETSPAQASTTDQASEVGLPPLRRDRRLLGWAVALGVSETGDQIFYVALAYTAAVVASPGLAGAIVAFAVAPRAVLSLFAGAMVDRMDARRVMVASYLAQMVSLLAAVAVLAVAGPTASLLIAVGIVFGAASAFDQPAAFSFPRQLRLREELTQVAGIRQLLNRGAAVGGPPLGGVLVAGFGLAGALFVDALTLLVIAVVLLLTRPRWPLERAAGKSFLADVRGGLAYVRSTPRVRDLVLALAGLNIFVSPVVAVGLALRTTQEGWGPLALGGLMGAIGAAAAVGTVGVLRCKPGRPVFTALLFLLFQTGALAAVGFAPYSVVLVAMVALGLTAGVASPLLSGTFQSTLDEEYIARAGSLVSLADDALVPVTIAGFGALAGLTSLTVACVVFGMGLLAMLLYSLSRPHVRAL